MLIVLTFFFGTSKTVAFAGKVKLNKDILLDNVLYVPSFTHNLVSAAQLIGDLEINCTFFSTHYTFQRMHTDHLIGVGKMRGNMYVIDIVTKRLLHQFLQSEGYEFA